jgi:hypothetical protein
VSKELKLVGKAHQEWQEDETHWQDHWQNYWHGSVVGLLGMAQWLELQTWLSGWTCWHGSVAGLVVIASLCVQGVEACWHGSSGWARG